MSSLVVRPVAAPTATFLTDASGPRLLRPSNFCLFMMRREQLRAHPVPPGTRPIGKLGDVNPSLQFSLF